MRKTLGFLLLVAALAALVPSIAAASGRSGPPPFTLSGQVTAVDSAARTVTVQVQGGNYVVKPYLGQNLTLTTTDSTRYFLKGTVTTPIEFEDLAVGQSISASGVVSGDAWNASRITVGAQLIHW